jgi:hypothetical protein
MEVIVNSAAAETSGNPVSSKAPAAILSEILIMIFLAFFCLMVFTVSREGCFSWV